MRIFIPYSLQRDIFKGEELKFAIRSIEKYLTGWEDIILIGTPPDWFNGKVIEAGDIEGRKEESIYRKMLLIEDEVFLRWDDDIYLLRKRSVKNIDDWYDGKLEDYKNGSARYQAAVGRTIELIPEALNFDIHAPMVFFNPAFEELFWNMTGDVCIKSYYASNLNSDLSDPGELSKQMTDLKISRYLSSQEIKKQIEGRLFFSTGTLFDPMREVLNELYPTPSKFEK